MAPSFYNSSTLSSTFLSSGASPQPTQPADNSLPTLAVVLGLIGVLVGLALIAGACIYIFRGRLFPPAESAEDQEKMRLREQVFNRTSCLSILSDEAATCHDATEERLANGPALRPLLLNPTKPRSHIKALLLPRFLRNQSYQAVSQDRLTVETKHRSFPYNLGRDSIFSQEEKEEVVTNSMRASQSCPARLSIERSELNSIDAAAFFQNNEEKSQSKLKDLKLVNIFTSSPPLLPPLLPSYESKESVYSEDSDCSSCSSGSVDWDYYINDDHEGLFYEGPNENEAPSSVIQTFTIKNGPRIKRYLPFSKRVTLANSKKSILRRVDFSLAKRFGLSRALKVYRMRNRAARNVSLRLNEETLWSGWTSELGSVENCQPHDFSSPRGSPSDCDSNFRTQSTDVYLKSIPPRSSSRQAFNAATDASSPSTAQPPAEDRPKTPERTRPSFLLNDVPADDLTTMSPPRFNCLRSPPRNPALLNTRWTPRPAIPPLKITIFAKHVSLPRPLSAFSASVAAATGSSANSTSKYPGRRVVVTPPAGTSLAELRGLVERALVQDDRDDGHGGRGMRLVSLRGMVFIGTRTLFLPLATERFYAQWVKERVKEGGCGIVEAWYD